MTSAGDENDNLDEDRMNHECLAKGCRMSFQFSSSSSCALLCSCKFAIPVWTQIFFVDASMELQTIAGMRQYKILGSAHTRSCVLAPKLRKSSLLGGQRICSAAVVVRCSTEEGISGEKEVKGVVLKAGSAVVVTEAPPLLKTAEPMPMMRPNNGLICVGDAGRIMDRRPKGTWAVRFAVGAYLIDRKYFEPLEL